MYVFSQERSFFDSKPFREFNVAYYFSDAKPSDWTAPQNDVLWQDGVKTLFDPCPSGWRVPKGGRAGSGYSPWELCSLDNSVWTETETLTGRLFDNSVVRGASSAYYPITGLRNGTRSIYSNINYEGAIWTSSSDYAEQQNTVYGFGLFEASIEPARNHFRGHGITVRCVRD